MYIYTSLQYKLLLLSSASSSFQGRTFRRLVFKANRTGSSEGQGGNIGSLAGLLYYVLFGDSTGNIR